MSEARLLYWRFRSSKSAPDPCFCLPDREPELTKPAWLRSSRRAPMPKSRRSTVFTSKVSCWITCKIIECEPELKLFLTFQNIRRRWRKPSKGTPQATSEGFWSLSLRYRPGPQLLLYCAHLFVQLLMRLCVLRSGKPRWKGKRRRFSG